MKLSQVIPPVLSLLIAIVWLANLRRSNEVVMHGNSGGRGTVLLTPADKLALTNGVSRAVNWFQILKS